jgi:hypothetical protein
LEQGEIERLVDRLLESDEFAVRAGEVLANWGAAHRFTQQPSAPLANAIGNELLVSDNLQHLVRKMLLVPGSSVDPLTVFHRFAGEPRGRAELIAATWLGVRVGCAQCHDHPLDHWTQDDYFAMAACWAEIETGADAGQTVRRLAGRTTTDLRSGREAVPRLPGDLGPLPATTTADEAWVAWLTDEANPQFSRNLANRIWAWLLGSGLVMEVDDHRATNPAVHAALLDHLAESLVESDFSLRSLVRKIVLSDCYARATDLPDDNSLAMDSPNTDATASRLHQLMWSVRVPKPIDRPLPQLASDALGSIGDPATAKPPESNAMESPTAGCSRGQACRDPFSESLELVAGEELNAFIAAVVRQNGNAAKQSPLELLDDFHFKLFGQTLNESERERYRTQWLEPLAPLPSPADVLEDILWSWLVSPAFRQQY